MDPRLAEIYGTNEESADVEKTAAAELAEKLAGDEEINLDGMSADELEALAKEVLSADEEKVEEAPAEAAVEEKAEETEKTASQKDIEHADYLGRVMAHAYVHELKEIEKSAAAEDKDKDDKKDDKKDKKDGKDDKKMPPFMKDKKSSASAFDTLAVARAREILEANGVALEEQAKEPAKEEAKTEEKVEEKQASSKYDQLAQAVEARAVELLKSEGYEFEE